MSVRCRIYFCACDDYQQHITRAVFCDPEFTWYEPQDIEKGIKIAKARGHPDGFFVPYKICDACRYIGCRSQYES